MNSKSLAAALLLSALLAGALPAALADCCGSACYHLDVPAPDRHTPVKGFCNVSQAGLRVLHCIACAQLLGAAVGGGRHQAHRPCTCLPSWH